MIFLKINCPNFIGLVWRRHTKFQVGFMAAAIPACHTASGATGYSVASFVGNLLFSAFANFMREYRRPRT